MFNLIMINRLFSLLFLILFFPLLMIVALIIIISNGFPIFYKQKRIGLNNVEFWIYKFRTMKKSVADIPTHLIDKNQQLYIYGGLLLRKFSMDEFPQLINILKGEMTFIGPRPALYNQIDLIKLRTEIGIHKLRPGITGWAQVNGRDLLSISQKVKLDKYYLDHQSLSLDLKIFFKTIHQIISPKGISN